MSANVATQYLNIWNETTADWEGLCGELANEISQNGDSILYVEGDIPWKYHMVLLRDGLIHDAWCEGDACSPYEWLLKMFGPDAVVEVSLNGDTVFAGTCANFPRALK